MITVSKNKKFLFFSFAVLLIGLVILIANRTANQIDNEKFAAPGRDGSSQKKVEDYFVEKLRMSPTDLERMKDRKEVSFRVTKNSTVDGIVGNLFYYGFVRDEEALRYALLHTKDNVPGKEGSLRIGTNGTIDINASYRISEEMTAWGISDTLLNKPEYFAFDEYGYLFMP